MLWSYTSRYCTCTQLFLWYFWEKKLFVLSLPKQFRYGFICSFVCSFFGVGIVHILNIWYIDKQYARPVHFASIHASARYFCPEDSGPNNTLQWRHNGRGRVSNHQPHDCLLNRLFSRRPKKTSKLRVTGLCAGNSAGTGEFPAKISSNAENVSIWWRHHEIRLTTDHHVTFTFSTEDGCVGWNNILIPKRLQRWSLWMDK